MRSSCSFVLVEVVKRSGKSNVSTVVKSASSFPKKGVWFSIYQLASFGLRRQWSRASSKAFGSVRIVVSGWD